MKIKLGPLSRGFLDIMRDFAPWTSTHAVPHIFMADALWIAIFWTIVFFGALALVIYQFYTVIVRYLSYPIQMDARIVSGIQTFPCVTFCNANPWKLSEVSGTPLEGLLQAYMSGQSNTEFGFNSPFSMREVMRAQRWTTLMFEELKYADQNESAKVGYSLNDILIDCTITRADCDLKTILSFYDAYYGHCHTFNYEGTLNLSRAGPNYGLRLQLRTPLDDYLPWVETGGIVFHVHGVNETPFEDSFGYFADVGRVTSVGVKYYDRTKLGSPYNTCIKKGETVLNYYSGIYHVEACIRSCIQDQTIKECNCYDPQYNRASNSTVISCYDAADVNVAIDCMDSVIRITTATSNKSSAFDIARDCDCTFSCDQSYYDIAQSQGLWPAKTYTPIECYNSSLGTWSSPDECRGWYRNNTVSLLVYYERINWETDIESGAYDVISMIADTGGQIGLWLGMSVVSVLEFVILFILLIMYAIIRPKGVDLKGFDYWAQFDKLIEENRNDDDPDLIYGDSDNEDGGPVMPPKVQESNPNMHVTEVGIEAQAKVGAKKEEKTEEKVDKIESKMEAKEESKKDDSTPPTVTESQPINAPTESKSDTTDASKN